MQTYKKITAAIVLSVALTSLAFAQPPGHPKEGQPGKVREKISQIKKIKLLEVLNLDEQTAEKFLAKYSANEKKVDEMKLNLDKEFEALHQMLAKNESKDAIANQTNKIVKMQEDFLSYMIEKEKSFKSILNETEFAKYIIFEQRFRQEFQKIMLDKMRKDGRGKFNREEHD